MKVGTLLLVISDTVSYLQSLGLIDDLGNMKAPDVQQDLQIAAFVQASLKKHGVGQNHATGKVSPSEIANTILQILPLILSLIGKSN